VGKLPNAADPVAPEPNTDGTSLFLGGLPLASSFDLFPNVNPADFVDSWEPLKPKIPCDPAVFEESGVVPNTKPPVLGFASDLLLAVVPNKFDDDDDDDDPNTEVDEPAPNGKLLDDTDLLAAAPNIKSDAGLLSACVLLVTLF
jgi:hypothetical protein